VKRLPRDVDVDPGILGQDDTDDGPAVEDDDPPELREEGAQGSVRCLRDDVLPENRFELVARQAPPLVDEAREEHAALQTRQTALDPRAVHARDERPAKLDSRLPHAKALPRPQGFSKDATGEKADTRGTSDREVRPMGKRIDCECGEVVKADTDDELVAKVSAHVERDHPELVGKLGRDDILGMAVEDE
jgi:hypothetical protein